MVYRLSIILYNQVIPSRMKKHLPHEINKGSDELVQNAAKNNIARKLIMDGTFKNYKEWSIKYNVLWQALQRDLCLKLGIY